MTDSNKHLDPNSRARIHKYSFFLFASGRMLFHIKPLPPSNIQTIRKEKNIKQVFNGHNYLRLWILRLSLSIQ